MLRSSKRQRTGHASAAATGGLSGSDDDHRRMMNPSLMTERQQLAFLLRKTAPDAPPASHSSDDDSSSSSDDDSGSNSNGLRQQQSASRNAKRIQRPASGSPLRRATTATAKSASSSRRRSDATAAADGVSAHHRARKLPHKSANKVSLSDVMSSDAVRTSKASLVHNRDARTASALLPVAKKLRVATKVLDKAHVSESPSEAKSSPSSSSDVLHIDTFDSDGSACGGDFWRLHCALCCDGRELSAHHSTLSNALFLCPSCDRKYPTQRALGRV